MKKLVILSVIVTFMMTSAFGQIANVNGVGGEILKENKYTDIKGSPYFQDEWKSGTAADNTGRPYPNLLVRYNIYKDVLEAKDGDLLIALEPRLYQKFTMEQPRTESSEAKTIRFSNGFSKIPGIKRESYLQVLYDGKYKFLKKYSVEISEDATTGYGSNGGQKTKSFVQSSVYYLINPDGTTATMGKLNKKNFMDALGSNSAKVEDYLSKEKFKPKDESAFVIILSYLEGVL